MKYDAIVFDFDGVLVESADIKTWAFGELYARYGKEIQRRVIEYHLTHAGVSRYKKFKVWQEEFLGVSYLEEDGERLSEDFSRLVLEAVVSAPFVAGAEAFLENYHRRITLFVVSGTPEKELKEIVNRRKIAHYFAGVYGAPPGKGELLKMVTDQLCCEPNRVLMVGDAQADWQGAMEAGTSFILRCSAGSLTDIPSHIIRISDLTSLSRILL